MRTRGLKNYKKQPQEGDLHCDRVPKESVANVISIANVLTRIFLTLASYGLCHSISGELRHFQQGRHEKSPNVKSPNKKVLQ